MNYRRMMLVALVLLAVLTLGAVSASEDADVLAADSVDEASVDASLDDEIISEGGGDSLASSDDASALEVTSENFEFDYQTHEAVSKQEDEVLHVWWHDSEWGILKFKVHDSRNNEIYDEDVNVSDANGEHSWTVPDLFSGNDYALGYYTFDLVFSTNNDDEVQIIDDLQFQLTYCNIEEYRDESVYIDYPFDVIRIYERTEVLDVYVNNVKIDNERNYDEGPTAWNLTELGITEPGIYNITINATNPNLGHVETFEMTLNVTGFDPNEWRVFTNYEGIHDFDENDPVIYLYCANEDTQNIVAIAPNEVWSYRDSVTGAMLSWTLSDLGIEENGDYKIYIGNGFDNVVPPVWINVWHMDDNGEEDENWILDYNSDLITFRELVTLSDRYDSGRLVITDSEGNVLFDREVDDSWLNYDMKGYKYDQFRGYVVFKEDLENVSTGVYDLTITYYDDEGEIVESVNTTVCLDYDSYVTDEEIDITDYNSTLFSIYVFDINDGYFEIELTVGDDEDEYPYVSQDIVVNDEMIGQTLDITRQNYDLPEGEYDVRVRFVSNDDDPHDHYVEYWKYSYFHDSVTIVDNTKFRVRMESVSLLDFKLGVYCPENYVNETITIEVVSDDESYSFDYEIPESGYNYFDLDDLNIQAPGLYVFNVYAGEEIFVKDYECEIESPLSIAGTCVMGTDDVEKSSVVRLYIDKTDDARLVLTDENENVFFNETLSNEYYYPRDGDHDAGYYILDSDLNQNLTAGIYSFIASYYCDDNLLLSTSKEVNVLERKYVEGDGASIELFDYYDHDLNDEEDLIAWVVIPNGDCSLVVELRDDEDSDPSYTFDDFEIMDDEGTLIFYVSLFDRDVEEGDYFVTVMFEDDNPALNISAWMAFYYGEGDENDDIIEDIEFYVLEDDDGYAVFEIEEGVHVASLFIPDNDEHVDSGVTVTITKNDEYFDEFCTLGSHFEYHENMMAYEYPICLDLTQLGDKDLLRFNVDCFDEDGRVWSYAIEINENNAIFHGYDEVLEYYVFYGNITTGDLNDPELMGPHPNGDFIEFSVPGAYGISEGSIVVSDGETEIYNKSLNELNAEYNYDVLGNGYAITLDEFNGTNLPENKTITVTLTAGNEIITQKRIRIGDYVYKILTPDDFTSNTWSNYNFEVADEVYNEDDDAVVIFGNSNRQSIEIDFGGGYFTVYVNDTKVEDLGYVLREAWRNSDAYDEDYDNEEVWGSELMLVNLRGGGGSLQDFHLSLADLGINEAGTYNIIITHTPDDPENAEEPYIYYAETEIVNKDITYNPEDIINTIITASSFTTSYGSGGELVATLSDANGNPIEGAEVVIALGDISMTVVTNSNGEAALDVSNLAPGTYYATVSFEGDDEYNSAIEDVEVVVTMSSTVLTAPDVVAVCGSGDEIVATLTDSNGKALNKARVYITIDGVKHTLTTDSNGQVRVSTADLSVGDYSALVEYKGTTRYRPTKATLNVAIIDDSDVSLVAPGVTVSYGSGGELVATLTDVYGDPIVGAEVVIALGDISMTVVTNSNGEAGLDVSNLAPGTYYATVSFAGDDEYNSAVLEDVEVVVTMSSTVLTAPDVVAVCGSGDEIVATLTDSNGKVLAKARVYITIDGVKHTLTTDSNGQVKLSTDGLSVGDYSALVEYKGTTRYRPTKATLNVAIVDKFDASLVAPGVTVSYGSGGELVATLTDASGNPIEGAEVVIALGDISMTVVTNSNGEAGLDVSNLAPGTYYATVSFKGDDEYNSAVLEDVEVVVTMSSTVLTAPDVVAVCGSGDEIVATLTDSSGNVLNKARVYITIDGVKYTLTTDSNGQVTLSTADLSIGDYTALVEYKGTTRYRPTKTRLNVAIVDKFDASLVAPGVTVSYGSGGEFVATLTDINGDPIVGAEVVIALGDISMTVVTNSNGEAGLDVSNLAPGTYYATVSFAGNSEYNSAVLEDVEVVVTMSSTVLTAPDVVAVCGSGDEIVATLTDSSGKALNKARVYITIDGVKHTLTTDSNGQVKLSTDGLSVGDYTALVEYKGTTRYRPTKTRLNVAIIE